MRDPSHRILIHLTPKHALWLNRIEMWFSILACKAIRRGNVTSVDDLQNKLSALIDVFDATMAKPFRLDLPGQTADCLSQHNGFGISTAKH
jgi:hypothetical protein